MCAHLLVSHSEYVGVRTPFKPRMFRLIVCRLVRFPLQMILVSERVKMLSLLVFIIISDEMPCGVNWFGFGFESHEAIGDSDSITPSSLWMSVSGASIINRAARWAYLSFIEGVWIAGKGIEASKLQCNVFVWIRPLRMSRMKQHRLGAKNLHPKLYLPRKKIESNSNNWRVSIPEAAEDAMGLSTALKRLYC